MKPFNHPPIIVEVDLPNKETSITCELPSTFTGNTSLNNVDQIVEAISNHNELTGSLSTINETLSSIPSGSIQVALISGLTSVFAAFMFNMLYWYIIESKKKRSNAVKEYLSVLKSLEINSSEYWVNDYTTKDLNFIQETRIKSELTVLREYSKNIYMHSPKAFISFILQKITHGYIQEYKHSERILTKKLNSLNSYLYDLITGDSFESTSRKADKKKVQKIITSITKIKAYLSILE